MATNLAYKPDYDTASIDPVFEERSFQISENQRPWVMTVKPGPRTLELDTGLRADVRLTLPIDMYSKLPVRVALLVERIKYLEALQLNWDSYNAHPLDDRAVRAAMGLIIEAERTCCAPDVLIPLSSGGLGLRWSSGDVDLEIDIDPDKTCSGTLEIAGEEMDLPRGSSLAKAMDLVTRFRRAR